jgi:hypothetical protein
MLKVVLYTRFMLKCFWDRRNCIEHKICFCTNFVPVIFHSDRCPRHASRTSEYVHVECPIFFTNLAKFGLCQQVVAQLPVIKINENPFSEFSCCYVRAEVRKNEHGEDNGRSFATFLGDPSKHKEFGLSVTGLISIC